MKVKPMLDDWALPHVESIGTQEKRAFAELPVPGRAGSLYHDMNTGPTRVAIKGSLFGDDARDDFLNKLRGKYRDGAAVTFVADIVTATSVQYVIIESLRFDESSSEPDTLNYAIVLRESPPPPPPPDPFGALDAGLLDQAGGFLDAVTGALDAINALGTVPDIKDPTPPLRGALDGVKSALNGLGGVSGSLSELFGSGG